MPIQKVCATCNKVFSVPPIRNAAQTCSIECKFELRKVRAQERWPSKMCPQCGTEFRMPTCHAQRRVYCSMKCKRQVESVAWASAEKSAGGSMRERSDGYVEVYKPGHPFGPMLMQHRLVMEEWLRETRGAPQFTVRIGDVQYLRREIQVHHKDNMRAHNDRRNLVACTPLAHRRLHHDQPVPEGEAWPLNGLLVSYVRRHPERPPI